MMNTGDRIRYTGVVKYLKGKLGRIDAVYSSDWLHVVFDGERTRSIVRVVDCERVVEA
jgi:hypothetical protein